MDINSEMMDLLKALGIPGIMTLILGWIGKRYLDKKLEGEKAQNLETLKKVENRLNQSLEIHKQKIKNWEVFFQKQFDASQGLYKIKVEMMPPYNHPDMDWDEAIEEMANSLETTYKALRSFLNKYFTVLNPDILEKLEKAAARAEEGALYGGSREPQEVGNQCAASVYKLIKECSSLLKAEVDGQRLVEFHDPTRKES